MTANSLLERHKSAYKSHHSTETALDLVQNDILGALDRRFGVILVLLDMSAAFDTVNHEILLNRLEHRYGMAGSVLAWMRSYLTDRSQCVYLPAKPASLVAYLNDRCWVLCYSLRTQLLSVILLGGTISASTYKLMIPSCTSNSRWQKLTDCCHYAELSNA